MESAVGDTRQVSLDGGHSVGFEFVRIHTDVPEVTGLLGIATCLGMGRCSFAEDLF